MSDSFHTAAQSFVNKYSFTEVLKSKQRNSRSYSLYHINMKASRQTTTFDKTAIKTSFKECIFANNITLLKSLPGVSKPSSTWSSGNTGFGYKQQSTKQVRITRLLFYYICFCWSNAAEQSSR